MKKYTILIVLILFILPGFLYAQAELKGTVKDTDTEEPLVGAHIFIPELQKGTITDVDGTFHLGNIPAARLKIEISHVGYKTNAKVVELEKDSTENILVLMETTVIHSDAVVVSGGTYSTQHENAIKIETLKSEEYQQMNAPTLQGKLAEIPGVDMISKGNAVVKPVIRGLSNSNILVLNNGVKLENFQFSENHPFMIDEFGVDRIEVIKGPASLLYGSDAVGGIINIIGEKPASTGSLEAEVVQKYHSNTRGIQTNVGIKSTYDDFFWGIRGGLNSHEDYMSGENSHVPNSRFNNSGIHAFTGINKSFGSMRLYYDYTQMHLGMTVPGTDTLVDSDERENNFWYQNLDNHLVISKNKFFLRDVKLEADFSYQQNNRELITLDKKAVDMKLSTYSGNIRANYNFNRSAELILGLQGNFKMNSNFDAPNRVLPDHEMYDLAVNGLFQQDFTGGLKMQAGLRYDYRNIFIPEQEKSGHAHEEDQHQHEEHLEEFSKNYSNISFSLGATYRLTEALLIRGNVASAYRTPNVAELTQEGVHGARFEKGNRSLNSQKNYEADLSFHYHCCHAMFDVSGFYNSIDDYIYLAPTGNYTEDNMLIYQYGQTNAILYGGEVSFEINPTEAFRAGLTWSVTTGERKDGSNLPFIPHDKLKGKLAYTFPGMGFVSKPSVQLGSTYAFAQKEPARFETETGDY
jgi:iron complex outermembrane receptor protein